MYENLPDDHIFTPAQAVEYLREQRGIIYHVDSLRNLRRKERRGEKIAPKLRLINNSL